MKTQKEKVLAKCETCKTNQGGWMPVGESSSGLSCEYVDGYFQIGSPHHVVCLKFNEETHSESIVWPLAAQILGIGEKEPQRPTNDLTPKEMLLASKLLQLAGEVFGNHGCNDVDESFWDGWTVEERQLFCQKFEEANGSPEDFDPNHLHLPDFALMGYLADRLRLAGMEVANG